jgi:cytochrome c biogenesis protein CcdA
MSWQDMARVCNIDARGRVLRFMVGVVAVFGGFIMALLITQGILPSDIYWVPVIGSIVGGMFSMWEARAGWCVVRAMGIKTPI